MSGSLDIHWLNLGTDKNGVDVYYRKSTLYDKLDINIDFTDVLFAASPFGGPIAYTRNTKNAQVITVDREDGQFIHICSANGKQICKFDWNPNLRGELLYINWTGDELLLCVSSVGKAFLFNIYGKQVSQFVFADKVLKDGILFVKSWYSGVAVLTTKYEAYVVEDLKSPKCEKLAQIDITEKPFAMHVVPSEYAFSEKPELVLAPGYNSIYFVDQDQCKDLELTNGPFTKISISPSYEYFGLFNEKGELWIVNASFTETLTVFETKAVVPPDQIAWCGNGCVCLYWNSDQLNRGGTSLLVMVDLQGNYQKITFDGDVYLVTEIDGLRIISNDKVEFLHRVPDCISEIFRLDAHGEAVMLYDAYMEFKSRNAAATKTIREIKEKNKLEDAVATCIEAATFEFDRFLQTRLLMTASFGKSFCKGFQHDKFQNACKRIRVLNSLRALGYPLTPIQYDQLTPHVLIDRLLFRNQHEFAYKLAEYLNWDTHLQRILLDWACKLVVSNRPEQYIIETIKSKFDQHEGISYAPVARTAAQAGKKQLAISLLELETQPEAQVSLLLEMKHAKLALEKALASGYTDLVSQVVLYLKKKMKPEKYFELISTPQYIIARAQLVNYCKERDSKYLYAFYESIGQREELGTIMYQQALNIPDIPARLQIVQQALACIGKSKDFAEEAEAISYHIKLLEKQQELEKDRLLKNKEKLKREYGAIVEPDTPDELVLQDEEDNDDEETFSFIGLSLLDTIYHCILEGEESKISKLKKEFSVSDKSMCFVQLKAYAKMGRWADIQKLAKRSPIGMTPFVEECIKYEKFDEALKYVSGVSNVQEKVELLIELKQFKEAISIAHKHKDGRLLLQIRKATTEQQTRDIIDSLLNKLNL